MRRALTAPLGPLLLLTLAACSGGETPDAGHVHPDAQVNAPPDAGVAVDAGPEPCEAWLIEYDLDGSEFEIRNTPFGAGDAVNAVGPGQLQLLFPGDEAGPKEGEVRLIKYTLQMQFDVAMVETDVEINAGPDDCGVALGARTATVVAWSTPMRGAHSQGTITCRDSEFICGAANLPKDMPVTQDTTVDQPLEAFDFGAAQGFSAFTMAEVEVPNDQAGDTFLRLQGAESTRRCVRRPTCE
jgi:hypothetical protein